MGHFRRASTWIENSGPVVVALLRAQRLATAAAAGQVVIVHAPSSSTLLAAERFPCAWFGVRGAASHSRLQRCYNATEVNEDDHFVVGVRQWLWDG